LTTESRPQARACTLAFDEGQVNGIARLFTDTDGSEKAAVWLPRVLFPESAIARYFKDAEDIAITALVPQSDPRLVLLTSDQRAAAAIRRAASAFWTNAYQWEMTVAGFRRLVENIDGLNFGARFEPVQFKGERRFAYFTLEDIRVQIVSGEGDQIRLAGVTSIDVLPDWSVVVDGEALP